MTVTVYKSTDASAPSLTGQTGALVALLDALLVDGYGSKPAQGWSIAFTATNKRVYQQPGASNQRFLRVDDTGTGSATYARFVGYETMSTIDVGVNAFPTDRQFSGGLYAFKSNTADATQRPWYAYGNGAMFYLFVATDSSLTGPTLGTLWFGDINSYTPGDIYNTLIVGGTSASTAQGQNTVNHQFIQLPGPTYTSLVGHYFCRHFSGNGGSVLASKFTNNSMIGINASVTLLPFGYYVSPSAGGQLSTSVLPYPNPPDGALYMERIWLSDGSGIRGELPGIWAPMQALPLSHLDTFSGSDNLFGRTFEVLRANVQSSASMVYVETSDTW